MSTRIRILSERLANKIAAGEVVERPAAVVKELVENALDAGADDIIVEIEGGGKRLVRVIDNGSGMSREDALLALERHATSKISVDEDLGAISTLGFRGEALPSIASVSRLTLASRESGAVEGTEIYVEGGKVVTVKVHGMAVGTALEVRSLFFNTPARLKFMRSTETEAGHVGELLTRLAISRPDIRFTYISDNRTQFRLLPGDLKGRLADLLGTDVTRDIWPLESMGEGIGITGFLSGPSVSRSSATSFYTYINGRFIRDRVVQHAIIQAYRGVLEKGRYPVVILNIDLPAGELDVNVHPTKHEVRFREQGRVHDSIQVAVELLLRSSPWVVNLHKGIAVPEKSLQLQRLESVSDSLARYSSGKSKSEEPRQLFSLPLHPPIKSVSSPVHDTGADKPSVITETGYYSSLSVIGQYNAMYILCQDDRDLVLIDQHAAHERIAFQQLKDQHRSSAVEMQGLLFPETVELTFAESACISEHLTDYARLGFDIEPFGGTTYLLKGVPRLLAHTDYLTTLRDILTDYLQLSRSSTAEDLLDEILAKIACHSVVRGVHQLSLPEIRSLLSQMDRTDFAATCPHGRPVICRFTLGEIEKMFKRSKSQPGDVS